MNPIELSLFAQQVNAVCSEMGAALQCAAFSPNIRDRLDFSCAMFDAQGRLCAQAAHIPVHLGSMAYAMRDVVESFDWQPGTLVVFNDPFLGGTHLPDVTLVLPIFHGGKCVAFLANRAHHADIGSDQPGSMPISSHVSEEGILLSPTLIGTDFRLDRERFDECFAAVQRPEMTWADLSAQAAANYRGAQRLESLIKNMGSRKLEPREKFGPEEFEAKEFAIERFESAIENLQAYSAKLAREQLQAIPDGSYRFEDFLDDDGLGHTDLSIKVSITVRQGDIDVDFTGSAAQTAGNVNCPLSVTAAAVYYVFRCLMNSDVPLCAGTFQSIHISAPRGSILNAQYPAAVAAGNVETSSRVTDVLLGALAKALPESIPAASQGTMNNMAMGSDIEPVWSYYETIGGGCGASAEHPGMSAVQSHMTNTQNTPIEVLEMQYPVRVLEYLIRQDSGGEGRLKGGDGIRRTFKFLQAARCTLITDRRTGAPWGSAGGGSGQQGENWHNEKRLPGKIAFRVNAGDTVSIRTPGGGGYGKLSRETGN